MTIKEYVINSVSAAIVLAAGTSVVTLRVNDARQDERIERLEQLDNSVDRLSIDLQRVDKKLERLDGKLDGEHEPRQ